MRNNRRKQRSTHSKYLLFALSPVNNSQTSPQQSAKTMTMADNYGPPVPEHRAKVAAVSDPKAPPTLSPLAPRASPVVSTETVGANILTPAPCHAHSSTPPSRASPLRRRRRKPAMTAHEKYLAGLSCSISMEERLSICLTVAKNLLDSVSCSRRPQHLLRSADGSTLALRPLHERAPANDPATSSSKKRPYSPTPRSGECPEQKRKPLFRLKLPVGHLAQLAAPATTGTSIPPPARFAVADLVVASSQQQQTLSAKSQTAQEESAAHEKCH
ncbi:uncharacterized protein EMH_0003590 [Eimeria mitis]|uniref:Uncharacterized protein n=1 Tax=Eimeria mitis TaxID=44415 RepID=U6KKK4_9EIME|nr:uncharacterized protein EMH_0003590 [Eimeria mitis]CDJ35978.1 hypothetical protein EMH_0003590 [Eimeria mitis]